MGNTWVTFDSHLNHVNIIDYCKRPFHTTASACKECNGSGWRLPSSKAIMKIECLHPDVEAMNETIIKNHNALVAPEDTVIHLGDFALGSGRWVYEYARRMNGKKILIQGNHDRHSKKLYQEAGFEVHKSLVLQHGRHQIYLRHRPSIPKDWPPGCNMAFCGHVHEAWLFNNQYRALNVGVDMWDFKPVRIEQAMETYFDKGWACQGCATHHIPDGPCSRRKL